MKKYLFDKIQCYDKGVKFIPFRKASIAESFLAFTHSTFNQEEWEFIAVDFKEFLKMLSKTKLKDNYEYDITVPLRDTYEEPISFDLLLKNFATDMYCDKSPDENVLRKFYSKAYQIREGAKTDKEILDKEPKEFLK